MLRIFVLRSGNVVTVNFNGTTKQIICSTDEETKTMFASLSHFRSEALSGNADAMLELEAIMDPQYRIKDIAGITRDSEGNFYLGNYSEVLPIGLVMTIKEYHDLGLSLEPLLNFWKLLMLNPDVHVRRSLFQFASRFSFPITDKGYFIAYKSVAWKGESDKSLALFIASEYIYKKSSGKSVDTLRVLSDDADGFTILDLSEYSTVDEYAETLAYDTMDIINIHDLATMSKEEVEDGIEAGYITYSPEENEYYRVNKVIPTFKDLGSLKDLYTSVIKGMEYDTPTFTDWHTKKSTIVLGTPVTMERDTCDNNPENTCSSGLHVGAPGYVRTFGGSDSYIIACLVSPMNVVAVPDDYNFEKMRTCEYLPYAICKLNDDSTIREVDTRYFEEDYASIEIEQLNKLLEKYENMDSVNGTDITADQVQECKKLIRERLIIVS